jgi:hypothetical protein
VIRMKRRIVLATVLCLAVAALGIGAAPALAAGGCDCHTANPPTAAAAHAPFVAGVACTTCHANWVVPHPDVGPPWLLLSSRTSATGCDLSGWVGDLRVFVGKKDHPDVVVYLQQRLWGATEYKDLTQVTTDATGKFSFTVASPPAFAAYRAIAQGHVGPLVGGGTRLFEPAVMPLLPKPIVRMKLQGLRNGAVRFGHRVRASGTVQPADMGGDVRFIVQKKVKSGNWKTRPLLGGKAAISGTGIFSWEFTPKSRGLFRVQASAGVHSQTTRLGSSLWRHVAIK